MVPRERFLNNRSACYLKAGNYHGTLEDCSQVLECLGKRGPMNNETAGKVHTRRSFALQELEMFREALIEMDAAIQYLPGNPSLIEMRERLREMVA
ncbi:hypothetical protein TCAL_16465 [Tigriopus californicus]|uniref:Uncharacterized protein n=1 Tax=Tigriopus californicus TaxID=6832 RepID=A0A553NIQ6_TIGCA|nr:hypothetical protein TCAL_16465 [Tigriopus californicus]